MVNRQFYNREKEYLELFQLEILIIEHFACYEINNGFNESILPGQSVGFANRPDR